MDFFIRILCSIPILGWPIREARDGSDLLKVFFFLNLVMAWLIAIYFFGYPAIIVPALAAVPIVFLGLISVTATDCFPKREKVKVKPSGD